MSEVNILAGEWVAENRPLDSLTIRQQRQNSYSFELCVQFVRAFAEACLDIGKQTKNIYAEKGQIHLTSQDYSELVSLGFYLRPSNLERIIADRKIHQRDITKAVFHVFPNNAITMPILAWLISVLHGYCNVVRVSERSNALTEKFLQIVNQLFMQNEFADIASSQSFLNYKKQSAANMQLSMLSDIRIIWGGDATVDAFKQLPTKDRSSTVCFPSRQSVAMVNLVNLISNKKPAEIKQVVIDMARSYCVDHLPFQQQACSSAKAIFWLVDDIASEKAMQSYRFMINSFWEAVNKEAASVKFYNGASGYQERQLFLQHNMLCQPIEIITNNSELCVIELTELNQEVYAWNCGYGCFYQQVIASPKDIIRVLPHNLQTVTYFGFENSQNVLDEIPAIRTVPFGQALSLSTIWDGKDLVEVLN